MNLHQEDSRLSKKTKVNDMTDKDKPTPPPPPPAPKDGQTPVDGRVPINDGFNNIPPATDSDEE